MEVKLNIPEWLKIPLNVLLPALWLFNGMLLLIPDKWLNMLYLLKWKNENGFTIGLSFLIVSCLLLVYLFFYLKKLISAIIRRLTRNIRTIYRISRMNDIEQDIIFKLYNSPGHTCQFDFNHPIVKGLIAYNYIHMGGEQLVEANVFTNSINMNFTLQPFVYYALDYYNSKMVKRMKKIENQIKATKNMAKKERLKLKLTNVKEIYDRIYGGKPEWIN